MKGTISKIAFLFLLVPMLFAVSCSSEDKEIEDLTKPVTYYNVKGDWEVSLWNSESLGEGIFVNLTLDATSKSYVMEDNLNSAVAHKTSGTFRLKSDSDDNVIISGTYDSTMGEDWSNSYYVTNLTDVEMTWVNVDNPDDVTVFNRVNSEK